MDKSNGYEHVATAFASLRESATNNIGASEVGTWAASLPAPAMVLDLGCGTGIPISKMLIGEGLTVYGIDASPSLTAKFKANFPAILIRCEPVEESGFFGLQFDGILAWGLAFLLAPNDQKELFHKISKHLNPGGKVLFTAPLQKVKWMDILTGRVSESLGEADYHLLLSEYGISVTEQFYDKAENHYFSCVKSQILLEK